MIKVTFNTQSSIYWAVCEAMTQLDGGGYLLDSLQEDSLNRGPLPWAKTPENWKIVLVEGA